MGLASYADDVLEGVAKGVSKVADDAIEGAVKVSKSTDDAIAGSVNSAAGWERVSTGAAVAALGFTGGSFAMDYSQNSRDAERLQKEKNDWAEQDELLKLEMELAKLQVGDWKNGGTSVGGGDGNEEEAMTQDAGIAVGFLLLLVALYFMMK